MSDLGASALQRAARSAQNKKRHNKDTPPNNKKTSPALVLATGMVVVFFCIAIGLTGMPWNTLINRNALEYPAGAVGACYKCARLRARLERRRRPVGRSRTNARALATTTLDGQSALLHRRGAGALTRCCCLPHTLRLRRCAAGRGRARRGVLGGRDGGRGGRDLGLGDLGGRGGAARRWLTSRSAVILMWSAAFGTKPIGFFAPGIAFIRASVARTAADSTSAPNDVSDSPFLSGPWLRVLSIVET